MIEYSEEYNDYWQRPDRVGTSSFASPVPIAREILAVCGPGRLLDIGCGMGALVRALLDMGIDAQGVDVSSVVVGAANRLAPNRFLAASVLKLPFADQSFDTVISTDCLEHLAPQHAATALAEIRRICRRNVYLRIATGPDRDNHWHLTMENRAWWERQAFSVGFRKHPGYYRANRFEALEHDPYSVTIPLERISDRALVDQANHEAADTSMRQRDMLRQTGRESDADLIRYVFAASQITPNQTVAVLACGPGHGCALLLDSSSASRVIGIDTSAAAIGYASINFARKGIEFVEHGMASLPFLETGSVGTVVAFDLPEDTKDFAALIGEVTRVLRPEGRFVFAVSGRTGNPLVAGDGARIKLQGCGTLAVERVVAVCAGGQPEEQHGGRRLIEIDSDATTAGHADWWLSVATRDGLVGTEGGARAAEAAGTEVAALCLAARKMVGQGATNDSERRRLIESLAASLAQSPGDTTSIAYLVGRLHQRAGELDQACRFYLRAVESDELSIGAAATVDQVDASFRLGFVALGRGDHDAARDAWTRGMACAQRGLGTAALFEATDDGSSPRTSPALQVADGARRCAAGLRLLPVASDKPGFTATRVAASLEDAFARIEEDSASRESPLRERLMQLHGELERVSRELTKTLGSYSWKVTAPLRLLADFIRGWMR